MDGRVVVVVCTCLGHAVGLLGLRVDLVHRGAQGVAAHGGRAGAGDEEVRGVGGQQLLAQLGDLGWGVCGGGRFVVFVLLVPACSSSQNLMNTYIVSDSLSLSLSHLGAHDAGLLGGGGAEDVVVEGLLPHVVLHHEGLAPCF